jgi:hypothetical protein
VIRIGAYGEAQTTKAWTAAPLLAVSKIWADHCVGVRPASLSDLFLHPVTAHVPKASKSLSFGTLVG